MKIRTRTVKEFTEDKNRVILACITIFLVLISWLGVFDYLSYAYLAESLLNALSSYGLSRALNGVISVLQSSTLSIGIASISVGQLLDPINDIIERFSGLLTLSRRILISSFSLVSGIILFIATKSINKNPGVSGVIILVFSIIALFLPPYGFIFGPLLSLIGSILLLIMNPGFQLPAL